MDPGSPWCLRVCLSSWSVCLGCDDEPAGHSTFKQARAPLGHVNAVVFFVLCVFVCQQWRFVPMSWGRQRPPALAVSTGRLGWAAKHQGSQNRQMPSGIRSLRGQHFRLHRVWMRCWISKSHGGSAGCWCFLSTAVGYPAAFTWSTFASAGPLGIVTGAQKGQNLTHDVLWGTLYQQNVHISVRRACKGSWVGINLKGISLAFIFQTEKNGGCYRTKRAVEKYILCYKVSLVLVNWNNVPNTVRKGHFTHKKTQGNMKTLTVVSSVYVMGRL